MWKRLFDEDGDEALPREWILLAVPISAISAGLAVTRDEKSACVIARIAADDFAVNILAALTLLGPGLLLTDVIARRLAGQRRLAAAAPALRKVGRHIDDVFTAIESAVCKPPAPAMLANDATRTVFRRPELHLNAVAGRFTRLEERLRRTVDEPQTIRQQVVSLEDDLNVVKLDNWPSEAHLAELGRAILEVDSHLPGAYSATAMADVHRAVSAPHAVFRIRQGNSVQLVAEAAPLAAGTLLTPDTCRAAAIEVSTAILSLLTELNRRLPRHAQFAVGNVPPVTSDETS
ncbi:hypothetical protein [Actinoplanes sp. GCM10030250]|uniref:hypothetical protein n=1 Tax=Actinoplanes sp. GCM10030250 TaxID=3273376 RepID=UPI003671363C